MADGRHDDVEGEEGPAGGADDTEDFEVQAATMRSGNEDEEGECDVEEGMECEEEDV